MHKTLGSLRWGSYDMDLVASLYTAHKPTNPDFWLLCPGVPIKCVIRLRSLRYAINNVPVVILRNCTTCHKQAELDAFIFFGSAEQLNTQRHQDDADTPPTTLNSKKTIPVRSKS